MIPVIGFYLQPSVGGRILPSEFWVRFAQIENVAAIKIAPFNRYQTLDVVRAVVESGRSNEIALYTGNDNNILVDLLTEYRFPAGSARIVGGLLGHWAVWTQTAVSVLRRASAMVSAGEPISDESLTLAQQITDMNAAIFDPANGFQGCIPGIHEVLRRQGLLAGRWCLDPNEDLSPKQSEEIDRVCGHIRIWLTTISYASILANGSRDYECERTRARGNCGWAPTTSRAETHLKPLGDIAGE